MAPVHHTTLPTPLGDLTIVCSSTGVVTTIFDDEERDPELARVEAWFAGRTAGDDARDARAVAAVARKEARAYLDGRARSLSVRPDLAMIGPGFGRRVLEVVATIPFGELWTYGDVAGMAGSPRAARAAGSALARCPIELFVPCHRVVHAGGTIGGYGRHEDRKRWLLRHEGAISRSSNPNPGRSRPRARG
jgi:methylated-DNA-[protein]-cysteine S-methyltransferase